MHKTVFVLLILAASIFPLQAAEVSKKVKDQAETLYGDHAKNFLDSKITQINPREVSRRLQEFCKPYQFFMVGIPVPKEKRTSMTPDVVFYKIASAEDAMPIGDAKEIAAFLTKLNKPISNEEAVLDRVGIFAEMIDATIRTHMPEKKSVINQYMDQKPEDWKLVISGTESGWKADVTLMTDKVIEYCMRYELEFTREGK
ncbi:MAG: hypothetical protein JSV16_03535, partial [Candidatus Hydrogenedentota bacterium]